VINYAPNPVPTGDVEAIREYLGSELQRLSDLLAEFNLVNYAVQAQLLQKPREGNTAFFLPGIASEEQGLHFFSSGQWWPTYQTPPLTDAAYMYANATFTETFAAGVQWQELTGFNAVGYQQGSTVDLPGRRIIVEATRPYLIGGSVSFTSDKNDTTFLVGLSRNNATPAQWSSRQVTGRQNGDQMNVLMVGLSLLNAGDALELVVTNNDAQAHTSQIRNASLWVVGI